jgi:hypothetical protein
MLKTVAPVIDNFLLRKSSLVLWAGAAVAGLLLLFCSGFLYIDQFIVPGPLGRTGDTINKQLGIWSALNWSVVFLVLFPLFLVCASRQASQIRDTISKLTEFRVFAFSDGKLLDQSQVTKILDDEIRSASLAFTFVIFAVLVVSIGGWVLSCAIPLATFSLNDQMVDWSTGGIVLKWTSLQYPLLTYTFVAYFWMGLALFVYLSCLFLGFTYSNFLYKFASGQYQSEKSHSRLLSREVVPIALADITYNFFVACFLGFVAAFFMQLEAAYLISDQTSITDYWFQNLTFWNHFANFWPLTVDDTKWQPVGSRNQTPLMSCALVAITLVSLAATLWLIAGALKAARLYTLECRTDSDLLKMYGLDITIEDERILETGNTFTAIFPGYKTSMPLVITIILCTLLPKLTLVFSAAILGAVIRYLRRYFKLRRSGRV